MNVKQSIKYMMRLSQLIFTVIMYIHCMGCLWYIIVFKTKIWKPPTLYIEEEVRFYELSTEYKYWTSLYHSVLLLTGNDIVPRGTL